MDTLDLAAPFPITVTDAALDRLHDAIKAGNALRVSIVGGGCAGMEYRFEEDTLAEEGDLEFLKHGIRVLVDPVSAAYLDGATLDFVEERFNAQFVLRNPNAKHTCGCGSSFSS